MENEIRHGKDVVTYEREDHVLVWSCQTGEVYRVRRLRDQATCVPSGDGTETPAGLQGVRDDRSWWF